MIDQRDAGGSKCVAYCGLVAVELGGDGGGAYALVHMPLPQPAPITQLWVPAVAAAASLQMDAGGGQRSAHAVFAAPQLRRDVRRRRLLVHVALPQPRRVR